MTGRVTCRVLAMDLRGHDVANVVRATYGEVPPPIILVGHSMGGAIAVHAASGSLLPSVVGLVVIDVVEGSAMDVLHSMQNFLKGRPRSFKSIDHAIEWSVKSGQIRNLESAKVSMVGQVRRCEVEDGDSAEQPSSVYSWRIDLSKAEKYWDGWFRGISNLFLGCNVPKLLLLAGIDRLDRDLTIGQMQGKFMMQVLPPCGHAVHEDTPDKVADALAGFMTRHKFAEARSETKRASECQQAASLRRPPEARQKTSHSQRSSSHHHYDHKLQLFFYVPRFPFLLLLLPDFTSSFSSIVCVTPMKRCGPRDQELFLENKHLTREKNSTRVCRSSRSRPHRKRTTVEKYSSSSSLRFSRQSAPFGGIEEKEFQVETDK
ncbi:Protein phosphatase methylesterase 1 [Bagarius yarrelli]|uniref:protein phosphatase methylesterase-1 n=1 Tax=Bagarius yarrelli TaxID=175774 RepID=A0A556U026_BAGYA|nr:Protein phosphatase methylesterase 1 [Bagarius yarrelli]